MARKKINTEPWRDDALEAVRVLRAGGVILHATDTVWGLACDATKPDAIKKLRTIKGKEESSPLLVLVADDGLIQRIVNDVPDAAWDLFELSERPTTVILPGGKNVDVSILGESNSLGIRRVSDDWTSFVCRGVNSPIVSTSANIVGALTPACFTEIENEISEKVDFISSHKRQDFSKRRSSFMVSFDVSGRFKVIRE